MGGHARVDGGEGANATLQRLDGDGGSSGDGVVDVDDAVALRRRDDWGRL